VAVVAVQCPECGSREVVKYGRQLNGEQRFRVRIRTASGGSFSCRSKTKGGCRKSNGKIVDMALHGSGIRDTARVFGVSPTTVIATLKKKPLGFTR